MNENFISEYKDSLINADIKIIYYDPNIAKKKGHESLSDNKIKEAFNDDQLLVFSKSEDLKMYLFEQSYSQTNLLFMSSGNYASLDLDEIKNFLINN